MITCSRRTTLVPCRKSFTDAIASWIKSEEDLALWSGNTFANGFSGKRFRRHLDRRDLRSFAYLDKKSKPLCYADIVRANERAGILCRVIVDPNYRNKGLGKAFCKDLMNWAREEGRFRKIHLNTFGHNGSALSCYESLGFRRIFTKRACRKVGEKWRDLVVMTLNLPAFHARRP